MKGHKDSVCIVRYGSNDTLLISGSLDCSIKIWNLLTKKNIKTLIGHINSVKFICLTEDSSQIISGSDDLTIKIWET